MGYQALSVANVASPKTEQRLNDLFTRLYYENQIPYEDDPEKEAQYGSRIWGNNDEVDPWEFLAWAVIGPAAEDYILYNMDGDEFGAKQIEKWFAKNAYSWSFFEKLQAKISHCHCIEDYKRLRDSIRMVM